MISTARLEREIAVHYPRMEGAPAYRAEVLADLNGVDEMQVRAILISGGYVEAEAFGRTARNRTRTQLAWEQIEPMYNYGMTDAEIAAALGYSASTIAGARRRHGHKANYHTVAFDPDTAMLLYKQGCNDHEISRRMGVSATSVHRWRNQRGLAMNYEGRGPRP